MTVSIINFLTSLFSSSADCQSIASGKSDRSYFHIRAAQPQDVSGITEILANSFHSREGFWGWAYPLLRLGIHEDLQNRLRSTSPYQICLVAVDIAASLTTDKLAGTVEMTVRSTDWASEGFANKRTHSRYPYLSNLAVSLSDRRRGVAGQMLLNCERIALSWGFQDIYLHVLENNYQARQLYFKLGYRLSHVDSNWGTWLLKRPRQLLLYKHISPALTLEE